MNKKSADQLELDVSINETRAELGAWAIVAGLILEVIIALGITLFGIDNRTLEHWFSVFATSLIAGGVYCEIHFGRKASGAHEALRAISDENVVEANAVATRAHERAAVLEKEAADARARTAEIERLTQWRRISPEQTDAIVHEIRRKLPPNITIESVFDPEAVMFADQLKDLLINADAAGVQRFARPMPVDGNVEFGLSVSSWPDVYSTVVTDAFRRAGLTISQYVTVPAGDDRMTLYVGYKPEWRLDASARE